MTTSTLRTDPPATSKRGGAGFLDLAWVTWRQYRWLVLGTALAVAAVSGFLLWSHFAASGLPPCGNACPDGGASPGLEAIARRVGLLEYPVLLFAGLVAAFWGAPLLSQEYEHRTHLWAWTQDVSPTRWLSTRLLALCATLTVLTGLLGLTGTLVTQYLHSQDSSAFHPYQSMSFDLWPPLQIGYVLFGFALGVAVSAVARRTVIAMLVTVLGFAAVRVFVAEFLRPHYLTPLRQATPLGQQAKLEGANLITGTGYLHTSGATMPQNGELVAECRKLAEQVSPSNATYSQVQAEMSKCLTERGWTQTYLDYQPDARVLPIQLVETGLYLGLAIVLLVLAVRLVRRTATL
ncbi:hypothetical protein M8C13_21855 [Crossiella sp. SN42]|uniref:hypothetical protein n=1 Tax=Crossiella sp. SN42 TaxID=2944808 RepID=UPI00207CB24F|nr:hypothetical protein [Crossiella sp. SN42]MCO1578399.1 hypothetical protein [Crossiella sp. SN42]